MDKLVFRFKAVQVDEIEKSKGGLSIENCLADSTISNLALFIMKGLVDDNGVHGVSRTVAMSVIDKYLTEHSKEELFVDIVEALTEAGFLSRQVNIAEMRKIATDNLS